MAKPRIWCVCKDPGGTAGILPVARQLQKTHEVLLITNGWASNNIPEDRHYPVQTIKDVISSFITTKPPAAVVTSMCSKGGIGRDLIPLVKHRCPTIALQDFWGACLWTDWADPKYRPSHIVVNDTTGANIVASAWPEYSQQNIQILPYPALDELANTDTAVTETQVRAALGLDDVRPIILFAGALDGTAETMREISLALNEVGRTVYFIPRLHPRTKDDAPDEYQHLNRALHFFRTGLGLLFTDIYTTAQLVQASTVVVAESSTVLVNAAALHKPNISVLYQNAGLKRFRKLMGGNVDEFPLVTLGCTANATNFDELIAHLEVAFDGSLEKRLKPNQAKHFNLDDQNAARVADFVRSLL